MHGQNNEINNKFGGKVEISMYTERVNFKSQNQNSTTQHQTYDKKNEFQINLFII